MVWENVLAKFKELFGGEGEIGPLTENFLQTVKERHLPQSLIQLTEKSQS